MLKRILVIDDDVFILKLMHIALEEAGYQINSVSGTDDILLLIQQSKPDLLIIDYLLEGKNGGELCRVIKNNENTAHLPVILFSAQPQILEFMGGYNCDAFLPKPFNVTEMVNTIKGLIRSSAQRTAKTE